MCRALDYVTELLKMLTDNHETILCSINIPEDIQNIDAIVSEIIIIIMSIYFTFLSIHRKYQAVTLSMDAY